MTIPLSDLKSESMSLRTKLYISPVIIFSLLILSYCEKPERIFKLTTQETTDKDVTCESVVLKGELIDIGTKPITDHGFVISESGTPTLGISREIALGKVISKGVFKDSISGLVKNTKYYFRAYIIVNGEEKYAETRFFKTKDIQPPVITAGTVRVLDQTSASLDCEVTSDGGEPSVIRGLCWDWQNPNPTITTAVDTSINGNGKGVFTGKMTGLVPRTRYYVRAYAINSKGISYNSADIIFKTYAVPQVTTTAISGLSNTGAISGGEVTDDGENEITARGVCWGTTNLVSADLTTKTSDGTGKGIFISNLTGLTPLTKYYLRAYATNRFGTNYGDIITFTTTKNADATTNPALPVLNTTATLNGTVNANSFTTTVSFEYGTSTLYGSTIAAAESPVTGSTPGAVTATLTGLTPGTIYHFRVKAVNSGGTSYGDDVSLITTQPPAGTTEAATLINTYGATLNGSVNVYNLLSTVTFEYGLTNTYGTEIPAVPGTVSGNLLTNISAVISGLTPSTAYHYRIKASNSGGTSYGNDLTFTTLAPPAIADYDGNIYNVVKIGTQYWMKENLKVTHFSNGDLIPTPFSTATSSLCWYYNNESAYKDMFGGLYNTLAVSDVKNLCPTGWHTSTDEEWAALIDFLGGPLVAGGELKETGTSHWLSPNTGATNSSGFTMLPGGYMDGSFHAINQNATFVTSQWHSGSGFYCRDVYGTDIVINRWSAWLASRSVRCIKGELALTETTSALFITTSSTTLFGKINPNGATTNVYFEYGTTSSYGSTASAGTFSGAVPVNATADLTGLSAGTTYHYRIKAVNSGGTSYGIDQIFSTTP